MSHAPRPADLNERKVNCDTYDTLQKVIKDHRHLSMQEDSLHHQLAFKNTLGIFDLLLRLRVRLRCRHPR